jgi:hypothetical protein
MKTRLSYERPLSRKQLAKTFSCVECTDLLGLKNMEAPVAVDFCGAWIQ